MNDLTDINILCIANLEFLQILQQKNEYIDFDIEYNGRIISGAFFSPEFRLKDFPGWVFSIWWCQTGNDITKGGLNIVSGTFFAVLEDQPLKPSMACNKVDFSLPLNNPDPCYLIDCFRLIKFIKENPELAFCKSKYCLDYNLEYISKNIAKKEYKDWMKAWNKTDGALDIKAALSDRLSKLIKKFPMSKKNFYSNLETINRQALITSLPNSSLKRIRKVALRNKQYITSTLNYQDEDMIASVLHLCPEFIKYLEPKKLKLNCLGDLYSINNLLYSHPDFIDYIEDPTPVHLVAVLYDHPEKIMTINKNIIEKNKDTVFGIIRTSIHSIPNIKFISEYVNNIDPDNFIEFCRYDRFAFVYKDLNNITTKEFIEAIKYNPFAILILDPSRFEDTPILGKTLFAEALKTILDAYYNNKDDETDYSDVFRIVKKMNYYSDEQGLIDSEQNYFWRRHYHE